MKHRKSKYTSKFHFLNIAIVSIFLIIIAYIFNIQVINHNIYQAEVNSSAIKQRKFPAPRGLIYDRNGVLLASNVYQNDLYLIPNQFHDNINSICMALNIDCDVVKAKISGQNRVRIARDIDDNIVENFKYINGLAIYSTPKRSYNMEAAAQHILGYVGRVNRQTLEIDNDDGMYADDDIIGQSGVEYIYNRELHGLNGFERYAVMANGKEIPVPNKFLSAKDNIVLPVQGNRLILSIDSRIQSVFAKEIGYNKGAGVMLDVHTGEIIAMYSSPTYDPQNVKGAFKSLDYPLMNRAINGYAPGSTFKIVVALAALELGIIKPDEKFDCPGYYVYGGRVWHCWNHHGHGKVDLRDAIKHSCDVYFYNLAQRVGISNIVKYAKLLGFAQYTGIDLPGENSGMIVKTSYKGSALNTAIGQGEVLVSPLQLARAYSILVNGGNVYSPKIVMGQGSLISQHKFDPANVAIIMDALYAVINEEGGTAYYSRIDGLSVAGKTGTSQKAGLDKKSVKDDGLFVGYYPAREPKIAVAVYIQDGEHGSLVAPIAFKAIQEYAKYDTTYSN